MKLVLKIKYIIVAVVFAFLSVLDLANYGLPPTHDGEYHVLRFWQFTKVLSEGNLYPRWAPDFNNGFGIPLFNYVYSLPNYAAALFHLLGFSFIDSFKLNMAAASIIGAIFFYLWARKYWGELGGVVSSVFYTFSPYHLLDIYVRGSVGEVWSLAVIPALLWSYLNFIQSNKYRYFVLSAVFLALLIYAHNILALIFVSFFTLYSLFLILHSKNIKVNLVCLLLIVLTGLGLAAPFWLPAILETKYVVGLGIFDPTQYFPAVYKLIYSSWGYGFAGPNIPDQMSTQIGFADIFVVFESICILYILKKSNEQEIVKGKKIIKFMVILFLAYAFLITPFSAIFWKVVPFASYVQFPWRLLSVVILSASFLAGSLCWDQLYKKKQRAKYLIASLLIVISIGFSWNYMKAPFYHKRSDSHYLTRSNFTDGTNSPGNLFNTVWLKSIPPKRKEKIDVLDGNAEISNINLRSTKYTFDVKAGEPSEIVIHTAYFPGWTARVNNKETAIKNVEGSMVVRVPKGSNSIVVWLGNTQIQNISYVYFLFSILLIVFLRLRPAIIK